MKVWNDTTNARINRSKTQVLSSLRNFTVPSTYTELDEGCFCGEYKNLKRIYNKKLFAFFALFFFSMFEVVLLREKIFIFTL